MKKRLFLTIFSVLAIFCMYSQNNPLSLGIRGGVNLSNLSNKGPDMDARVGYQFGIVGEYQLPNNFFLNGSLNLTSKGAKLKMKGDIDYNGDGYIDKVDLKTTWNSVYMELPIMVGYKVSVADNTAIKFMAGPYIAYGVGGKISAKGNIQMATSAGGYESNKGTGKTNTFSDETLKRFDAGLSGGVAVEYSKFTFTIGYEYGLANISQGTYSIHNRNAFVTLGYTLF